MAAWHCVPTMSGVILATNIARSTSRQHQPKVWHSLSADKTCHVFWQSNSIQFFIFMLMLLCWQTYRGFYTVQVSRTSRCDIQCGPTFWSDLELELDSKKWPDIPPTGTTYPVHTTVTIIHNNIYQQLFQHNQTLKHILPGCPLPTNPHANTALCINVPLLLISIWLMKTLTTDAAGEGWNRLQLNGTK